MCQWIASQSVTIQMKAIEHFALSCGAVYYAVQCGSNVFSGLGWNVRDIVFITWCWEQLGDGAARWVTWFLSGGMFLAQTQFFFRAVTWAWKNNKNKILTEICDSCLFFPDLYGLDSYSSRKMGTLVDNTWQKISSVRLAIDWWVSLSVSQSVRQSVNQSNNSWHLSISQKLIDFGRCFFGCVCFKIAVMHAERLFKGRRNTMP